MGAAKLLSDNDSGSAAASYNVTLGSDPANDIVPKLINGELDLAAIPTNLAAALYNRTGGEIQLLALNTLGVLHILENGESVHSLADLAGKTLYATGQGANPEYVLNYLLEQNGLTPGVDVTIEWKASDELTALMASGEAALGMLPVPAATSVMMQNQDVRDAIDLNKRLAQRRGPRHLYHGLSGSPKAVAGGARGFDPQHPVRLCLLNPLYARQSSRGRRPDGAVRHCPQGRRGPGRYSPGQPGLDHLQRSYGHRQLL